MRNRHLLACTLLTSLLVSSCSTSLGPASVKQAHRPYNDSVIQTLNEQFLLNLVRLKYRDNPYFIEIGSITSQQSVSASIGSGSEIAYNNPIANLLTPSAGVAYSDSPTITYTPLQGENFSTNVMAPIPMEALLKLSQSGWSISRVFRIAVEQANDLYNAPTASGPTPVKFPEYEEFQKVAHIMRRMQQNNGIDMILSGDSVAIEFVRNRIPENERRIVRQALGLRPSGPIVRITTVPNSVHDDDTVYLQTRSIMGVLFFLSHNVEIPPEDIRKGLVTMTRNSDGSRFDWDKVTGDLLRVKTSPGPPTDAFVKVKYRGHWFYIRDNDLDSKSTFMLLNQIFSLQAGDIKKTARILTIPVGG